MPMTHASWRPQKGNQFYYIDLTAFCNRLVVRRGRIGGFLGVDLGWLDRLWATGNLFKTEAEALRVLAEAIEANFGR